MTRTIRILAVVSFVVALAPSWEGRALAGSATSNMAVSATVSNNCTISAGALAFGAYDPVSANASSNLNGTATLTVTCTTGASASITLDQGTHANTGSTATVPLRRLSDGAGTPHYLSYYLYSDSARSTVWGASTADVAYTGTGTSGTVTVYGAVTSGQNVPAGTFTDTVVATISF